MNEWMNSLIGIKNQLVHKGIQHLHVSKQATKISEIRLHYLGYKHKTQWKKHTAEVNHKVRPPLLKKNKLEFDKQNTCM